MRGIGGNIYGTIQVCTTQRNDIGETVQSWSDVQTIFGWLDLRNGDSRYTTYNAKIQDSTHVFVADYVPLDSRITAENSRMIVKGKVYDIKYLDNPMEMQSGSQWEIYLDYTGGQ